MQRNIRCDCIDPPLRHTGDVGELVERCKAAVKAPVFHNALRKRRSDSGKRCKRTGISGVQIDVFGERAGFMRTTARRTRRRLADTRDTNLLAVRDMLCKIDGLGIGIAP